MQTMDSSNANQLWIESGYGKQLLNVGTGLALKAGRGRSWNLDDAEGLIWDSRNPKKVIDRGWGQKDGQGVGYWKKHNGINQRFDRIFMN